MSTKDYPKRSTKVDSDSYKTDEWILSMLGYGYYDPCPFDPNYTIDGLKLDWNQEAFNKMKNNIFVNPPYSNPKPWVKKAIRTVRAEDNTLPVIMLLKHDSSTEWYRLLHEAGAHFLLINERLKHGTNKTCAFPSLLAVLR
tara:strand:+ start:1081 stop:1503 length:423 start_codon:yes stop_codon:yes gene_type:complete